VHELSLARSILEVARRYRPPGARVRAVHLQAGPLQAIDAQAMQWAWQAVCEAQDPEDSGWAESRLQIEWLPWPLHCRDCDQRWTSSQLEDRCRCGSTRVAPAGGDALQVMSLDVDLQVTVHSPVEDFA